MKIKCKLIKGHKVASGLAENNPFKEKGLNIDNCFNGTLNVNISPYSFDF